MAIILSNEYDHIDIDHGTDINRHMLKDNIARIKYDSLLSRYVGTPLIAEYISNTLSKNANQSVSVNSVYADVNITEGTPFSITVIDTENGLTSVGVRWYINNATSQSSPPSYASNQQLNTPLFYIAPTGGITKLTLYAAASLVKKATTLQFIVHVYLHKLTTILQIIAPVEIGISTHYYDIGDHIMVNGILYKVTNHIEPGQRLDETSNITLALTKVSLINHLDSLIRANMGVYNSLIHEGHLMSNGLINTNTTTQNYYTSDWLPIKIGEKLHYRLVSANNYCVYVAYDAMKNVVESQAGITSAALEGVYTAITDGYIRVCCDITWAPDCYFYITSGQCNDFIRTLYPDIPNYWLAALDNAREKIRTRDLALNTGDKFFFITDVHWRNQKNKMSSKLISKIADEFNINLCLIGGDIIASTALTLESGYQELQNYLSSFKNSSLKLFTTIGNHDITDNILNLQQAYNILMKPMENFAITSKNTMGAYYDNLSQQIRYIQFRYTSNENFSNDVANWLTTICENTPIGWTIVVMSHSYWSASDEVSAASISYGNHLLSLKQAGANIALWLVGHTHLDKSTVITVNNGTTSTQLLVVSTTTDNVSTGQVELEGYARANNTATESAFDIIHLDTTATTIYFTRIGGWFIGAGEQPVTGDRAFNYSTCEQITYE